MIPETLKIKHREISQCYQKYEPKKFLLEIKQPGIEARLSYCDYTHAEFSSSEFEIIGLKTNPIKKGNGTKLVLALETIAQEQKIEKIYCGMLNTGSAYLLEQLGYTIIPKNSKKDVFFGEIYVEKLKNIRK